MAEWSKAHDWKSCVRKRTEGSNPSLSSASPAPQLRRSSASRRRRRAFVRLTADGGWSGSDKRLDGVDEGGAPMNKDELKGKAENLKGRVKEAFGALTGDKKAQAEGEIDRGKG